MTAFTRRKRKKNPKNNVNYDYAIIVTAFEQTHMLPSVVDSILRLTYNRYHIYVVADHCDISNLTFSDHRVSLLRPSEILASNTKSHAYAIEHFVRKHDIITIIDSDNLVHQDYIKELNVFFNQGFEAVQGVREAKNVNTTIACVDAARDLYYNFYDGKVMFSLGSSSTLAGSGMAFKSELYMQFLKQHQISGAGFDKVLQAFLLLNNYRIAYAANAIVYDEKTAKSGQLVDQRARWIDTWFKYVYLGRKILVRGIRNSTFNQILFGIILLRPPLFVFLIISLVFLLINLIINPLYSVFWVVGLGLFIAGFFIALIKQKTTRKIYKALGGIPMFILLQLISLYYSRTSTKRSISTKHT